MQTLNTHLALTRDHQLRAASAAPLPRLGSDTVSVREVGRVVLRRARPQDGAAVAHLAALDEAPIPHGDVLIVELDERIVAAVPVDRGGKSVADPFQRTAGLVDLAERRAALLRGELPRRSRLGALRHVATGRRAAA